MVIKFTVIINLICDGWFHKSQSGGGGGTMVSRFTVVLLFFDWVPYHYGWF